MAEFTPLETFRESVGLPDRTRSERIRDEFRARIATMAPDDSGRRPFDSSAREPQLHVPTRHRQPVLALATLAVILGLAAGGAFWLRHDTTGGGSFQQLAAAARAQPDVALDETEFLYVAEQTSVDDTTTLREQWTARDGTGQATESAMVIGSPGSSVPSMTVYGTPGSLEFAHLSYDELRTLPTDPHALLERLAALGVTRTSDAVDQAEAIAAVLALDVTPAEVLAAGVQALDIIGGTTVGPVTDGNGRVGVGVRGDNGDGTSWLVILDASSARTLAFHPDITSVTSNGGTGRAWTDQRITDSLPSPR
jgi:hypothetical protein